MGFCSLLHLFLSYYELELSRDGEPLHNSQNQGDIQEYLPGYHVPHGDEE